ncbi:MAG: 4-hydroxy-tetrahydrodipicolinate reductase [Hyphomicrobiales bacterium]|nr:4-hydroxy-tetrahydrodipicolinate reductase [Hyphomicrobiales bacterium]
MKVVLDEEALDDLQSIYDWIARDNPSAAEALINRILDRAERLAAPELTYTGRPGLDAGTRELVEYPYIMVYEGAPGSKGDRCAFDRSRCSGSKRAWSVGAGGGGMSDMRLVVAGAGGRMGRTLVQAIAAMQGATLAGAVDAPGVPSIGRDAGELAGLGASGVTIGDALAPLLAQADGLIDFTIPAATVANAELAARHGLVHVIGTTGLSAAQEQQIAAASERAIIVKSGNMSLGVNLLAALVKRVAATLDEEFDIEIVEMHHNKKIDAPSGTALMLGRAAAEGRGIDLNQRSARGRDGHTGARQAGDIGFASLRGGTVVGDHSVIFAGPAERIELTHKAEDRMIFARGAVRAALWARGRKPGLYTMTDVLGLREF